MNYYYIIAAILLAVLLFLYMNKVFQIVTLSEIKFGPEIFLCFQYQGKYQNVGKHFQMLAEIRKKYLPLSYSAGIYYDNPSMVIDSNKCRAVLGFIVNKGEYSKINQFLYNNPSFQQKQLPLVNSVITNRFPLTSTFSMLVLLFKLYPKLINHMENNHLNQDKMGIMEIYPFDNVQIFYQWGQNCKDYYLTQFDKPLYNEKYEQKMTI